MGNREDLEAFSVVLFWDTGFGGLDKTDRFIISARRRAEPALHETSPKLTALEKAMWLKLKRGELPGSYTPLIPIAQNPKDTQLRSVPATRP